MPPLRGAEPWLDHLPRRGISERSAREQARVTLPGSKVLRAVLRIGDSELHVASGPEFCLSGVNRCLARFVVRGRVA